MVMGIMSGMRIMGIMTMLSMVTMWKSDWKKRAYEGEKEGISFGMGRTKDVMS